MTKDNTTIVDGAGAPRMSRAGCPAAGRDRAYGLRLGSREAPGAGRKLAGGVCVIKVGAATEVELKEKKHRIEDAAPRPGQRSRRVVAGGGSALIHAGVALKGDLGLTGDEKVGVNIVRKALVEPTRWIAENGGEQGYVVTSVAELEPGNGYNAATGEYGDLIGAASSTR